MEGFDIELKHGIILTYQGKPLYHLAEMLEQIRRDAESRRAKEAYSVTGGYAVKLGRNPGDPPPTAAEWLEVVSDIMPVVEEFKRSRKGTKALHEALVKVRGG